MGRLRDDLGEELLQRFVARVLSELADHLVYQPDQIVDLVAVLEAEQQGRYGAPPREIITRKRALVQEIIARPGLPRPQRRLRRKGDEAREVGRCVRSLVTVVEDDGEHGRQLLVMSPATNFGSRPERRDGFNSRAKLLDHCILILRQIFSI